MRAALSAGEPDELVQSICATVVKTGGYRMAWVGVAEQNAEKSVRIMATAGYDYGYLDQIRIAWSDTPEGRGPSGTAIRTGTVQVNQNFKTNPQGARWRDEALKRDYQSSISVPLKRDTGVFGVLTIYSSEPSAFGDAEKDVLIELTEAVHHQLSMIETRIEKQRIEENLRKTLVATIEAIAATIEMRDPYTAGHQHRVAALAQAIALATGLDSKDAAGPYFVDMVHDVGKINLPAEILSRPGRLSKIEMDLIRFHPQTGYEILRKVTFPWPVAKLVLQHHERLDGSGYPYSLQEADILPGAKILAIADVVEAMTSHRPYRPALGLAAALAEIKKNKGILYDAAAPDACLALFRDGTFSFDEENRPLHIM